MAEGSGIDRRKFHPDLAPVALQLLGKKLRTGGRWSLPHLALGNDEGDAFVRPDVNVGIRLARRRRSEEVGRGDADSLRCQASALRQDKSESQTTGRGPQEAAPADVRCRAHALPPMNPY